MLHSSFDATVRKPGSRKYTRQVKQGWKPSQDPVLPNGVYYVQFVDREFDKFDQTYRDARTGEIIHEEHEPLSKHGLHK